MVLVRRLIPSSSRVFDSIPSASCLQMIPSLPEDIYVTIFRWLSLYDVLSVRKVCRSFYSITRLRGLWISLLRTEIWAHNIPTPPHLDVDRLNAAQLEKWVKTCLLLHRNWTSASPIVRRRRYIAVSEPQARITSLHFITLDGESCLLSFSLMSRVEPRMLTVECWELNTLKCIARRRVQWFGGYAVNSDPNGTGLTAIRTPHVEVLAFDSSASSPDSAFVTLFTLSTEARSILCLAGTTMIFRSPNNDIKMLDITRPPYEITLEDNNPAFQNQPDSFQAIIYDDYTLILRTKTLALYALHDFRAGRHPPSVPLSPVQLFEFPWRIDSCCMERQISPSSARHGHSNSNDVTSKSKPSTINILIRYSSLFPWPVNMLHHFILHPNPSYVPLSSSDGSTSISPSVSNNTNDYSSVHMTINPNNLPYEFPPVSSQTIVSPVRLFAITDMALGRYGTAVWLDSHTEDYFYHGDVGQRLAGIMLLEPSRRPSPCSYSSSFAAERYNIRGSGDEIEGREPEASTTGDQNSQRAASIVFAAHESDDWNRVAMDEGEGRVAVGSVTGEIMIDDYAEER
ncbi:hypothetical protein GYMLUDRAFT_46734 [Collybiopsis luxurians FD-317 M1]|uniref:F-box domain-containing protein n=1 Tax=Collybiopsis luxurians FD-317 M1 TaxID=944289 RepID=A0A0D0BPV5_9AGAR|nr:hypothetical protein GYMLUDRAFT_46734 [Collybiopsis luxurians FD-317 M1]